MFALVGIALHAIGGFCAGSFYSPLKKIDSWSWESSWLVMGFFAWLLTPLLVATLTVDQLFQTLQSSPSSALGLTFMFGVIWGIGGPIFNMTMKYLGVSLGMTVSLGSGALFGTLIPPIVEGKIGGLLETNSGQITFLGILLCFVSIIVASIAGHQRDKVSAQLEGKPKFNTTKGIIITFLSGPIGASFAYGLAAGKPIATNAMDIGTDSLWQNNAVLVILLLGGLSSNFVICILNNIRNSSFSDYFKKTPKTGKNYFLAALGGIIWYFQFMFYGMGSSLLDERFHFASWTIHMSFIILFGNLWGLYFKEWNSVSKKTIIILLTGLTLLALSTVIIAIGSI